MQYQVFVQSHSDQKYIASVVGTPNCTAEGSTKHEAIANAKAALEAYLETGELVTIEVNSHQPPGTIPQKKYTGVFANDPSFDDFMEKLATIRKEANVMENEE